MALQRVKTFMGIEISINPDTGRFSATINGKLRALSSQKAIEREIKLAAVGVTVMTLSEHGLYPSEPGRDTVIRTDSWRMFGFGDGRRSGEERAIWGNAYAWDEGVVSMLTDVRSEYLAAKEAFDHRWAKRWADATSELKPLTVDEVRALLRKAAASLDEDKS